MGFVLCASASAPSAAMRMPIAAAQARGAPRRHVVMAFALLLRLQSGLLDDLLRGRPVVADETRELLGRTRHRLQATLDQIALAKSRLVDNARRLLLQAKDDRSRRSRGSQQAEIGATRESLARPFGNGRNGGEQRRTLVAVDQKADHRAALELRTHVGDAVEADRRRAVEQRGHRLAAAAE